MSWAPQGSVLGPMLFNIFVGNMGSRIEYTLRKFDNINLCGAAHVLKGRDVIQRHVDSPQRCARADLAKFSKA